MLPCPKKAVTCQLLTMEPALASDAGPAVSLVKMTFPHMNIPDGFWKKKLHDGNTIVIKENGKDIVGVMNISIRALGSKASLDLVAIHPGYQGSGLGKALVSEAERIARSAGKKTVQLMTEQSKPRNVSFYSTQGYKVTGYDPHGYAHSPSVHFSKDLDELNRVELLQE